jgi:hypothetical protein
MTLDQTAYFVKFINYSLSAQKLTLGLLKQVLNDLPIDSDLFEKQVIALKTQTEVLEKTKVVLERLKDAQKDPFPEVHIDETEVASDIDIKLVARYAFDKSSPMFRPVGSDLSFDGLTHLKGAQAADGNLTRLGAFFVIETLVIGLASIMKNMSDTGEIKDHEFMSEVVDRLGVHFLNLDNMQASVQNK